MQVCTYAWLYICLNCLAHTGLEILWVSTHPLLSKVLRYMPFIAIWHGDCLAQDDVTRTRDHICGQLSLIIPVSLYLVSLIFIYLPSFRLLISASWSCPALNPYYIYTDDLGLIVWTCINASLIALYGRAQHWPSDHRCLPRPRRPPGGAQSTPVPHTTQMMIMSENFLFHVINV